MSTYRGKDGRIRTDGVLSNPCRKALVSTLVKEHDEDATSETGKLGVFCGRGHHGNGGVYLTDDQLTVEYERTSTREPADRMR